MAVDYDLVVIGATAAGLATAQRAIAFGQKVALVQQNSQPLRDLQEQVLIKVLLHLAEQAQSENITDWVKSAIAPWDFYEPLAKLAESGVDVIPEQGSFVWQPRPRFLTETRSLRSKNYAIATGTVWAEPSQTHFLTLADLLNPETWQNLAENIILVGTESKFLHLAYALAKLGKKVTLIGNKKLFSSEDAGLIQHLQTFLEVSGIELYLDLPQAEKDHLLKQENVSVIWGDRRRALTTQLNLPPDFCHSSPMYLKVNSSLQTLYQNIYGCGSVLGGYDLPELAIAEATTISQNITTNKPKNCPYELIPYRLFEPLPFDHIGYQGSQLSTETKTIQKTFVMDTIDQWQFPHDLTVKLWLNRRDKILGTTVIGDRHGKLIYHGRHLIQSQKAFTTWHNLLEQAGILAEIY